MAVVAVVGFEALVWLKKVGEDPVKDHAVSPLAGRVGPQDPHQIPGEDVDSELVMEHGLAAVLVGTKKVPLLDDPLLLDTVICTINHHETIVLNVIFKMAFKHYLWFCKEAATKK
jgi:hypothetical protein